MNKIGALARDLLHGVIVPRLTRSLQSARITLRPCLRRSKRAVAAELRSREALHIRSTLQPGRVDAGTAAHQHDKERRASLAAPAARWYGRPLDPFFPERSACFQLSS